MTIPPITPDSSLLQPVYAMWGTGTHHLLRPTRAMETAGLWTSPIRLPAVVCGQLAGARARLRLSRPLQITCPQTRRTFPQPLDNCCAVAHSSHSPDEILNVYFLSV